jgi:hypothetical protein
MTEDPDRLSVKDMGWMGPGVKPFDTTDEEDRRLLDLLSQISGKQVTAVILSGKHSEGIMTTTIGHATIPEIINMLQTLGHTVFVAVRAQETKDKIRQTFGGPLP